MATLLREVVGIDEVAEAKDGPGVLEAVQGEAPHLVILDLNLPGQSGLDLLPFLKLRAPASVVIVLTNHAGDEYEKRCRALGADHFFDKSSEFQSVVEVARATRTALGRSSRP
jgi:DNA-binding NarL/FixJ family response regulator